jgi:hypothetical protein
VFVWTRLGVVSAGDRDGLWFVDGDWGLDFLGFGRSWRFVGVG